MQSGISAAILAGGLATRMDGADKASLVVGGMRIIERQLAVLDAVSDDVRIIANDASRYADLGRRVIGDAIAGAGPMGGLYTALLDARHDRVIVLACDLPFVSAALVERLVTEGDDTRAGEEIDAVVPRTTRGLEPLCAVYRTRCAPLVGAHIARGERRMTALLANLAVRDVYCDALAPHGDEALFQNVNTPHDYARARDLVALDEKPSEDRITE